MPTKIEFELLLEDKTIERLKDSLKCSATELPAKLSIFGKASLMEYVEMFSGNSPLRSSVEVKEQRLLQIILAAYEDDIPDVTTVARLFQLTRVQARFLLRAVTEKKAFELKQHLDKVCAALLQKIADPPPDPIKLTIKNQILLDYLNSKLMDDGTVPLLEKPIGLTYKIDPASFVILKRVFLPGTEA